MKHWLFLSVLLVAVLEMSVPAAALGDTAPSIPPYDAPDWWTPPNVPSTVRLQYHSFDVAPVPGPMSLGLSWTSSTGNDYVDNGYIPSVNDSYSVGAGVQYGVAGTGTTPYDDGTGMYLPANQSGAFSKIMGNRADPNIGKAFFFEIAFQPLQTGTDVMPWLDVSVLPDSGSVVTDIYRSPILQDPSGWDVEYISGSIWPQPDQETFTISTHNSAIIVDGAWMGTDCPEPSSLVLLATSVISLLAYAWRRRRQAS